MKNKKMIEVREHFTIRIWHPSGNGNTIEISLHNRADFEEWKPVFDRLEQAYEPAQGKTVSSKTDWFDRNDRGGFL